MRRGDRWGRRDAEGAVTELPKSSYERHSTSCGPGGAGAGSAARVPDRAAPSARTEPVTDRGSLSRPPGHPGARGPRLQGQVQAVAARPAVALLSAACPARRFLRGIQKSRRRRDGWRSLCRLRPRGSERLGLLPGLDDYRYCIGDQQLPPRPAHSVPAPGLSGGLSHRLASSAGGHRPCGRSSLPPWLV